MKRIHYKCIIEGCNRHGDIGKTGIETFKKGYCSKHYASFKKHGDPLQSCDSDKIKGRPFHPLYKTYHSMKTRCFNANSKDFNDYGGKGVSVCDRWMAKEGFENFCEDMGVRPENHTLDRIDVKGNYEPSNCRWASHHQQASNKRGSNKCVGVSFSKDRNNWKVEMSVNKKYYYIGRYEKYEDAVFARKEFEKQVGVCI